MHEPLDNHDSPLLLTAQSDDVWLSLPTIVSLTCAMGGLQVVWSTIFSTGTLYLLDMRLPEAHTAIIWAIPAFCGCFVQPYVGIWSDTFEHRWGRRLPFIFVGACGISSSILIFAWADDLGYWTALHLLDAAGDSETRSAVSEAFVISGVCMLSLAIQPLQCALRALPLDLCTTKQQFRIQRWASIFSAIGQVVGCAVGVFAFSKAGGDAVSSTASFRVLCIASILAVDVTVAVTIWSLISHRCLRESQQRAHSGMGTALHTSITRAYRNLSRAVREVLFIQSLAWTGWFTFLYYNTSYLTSLYLIDDGRPLPQEMVGQIGPMASLLFACVALLTIVFVPPIISHWLGKRSDSELSMASPRQMDRSTLLTIWSIALLWSSLLTFSTLFTKALRTSMALTTLVGMSWAINNWLPFTLIGQDAATGTGEEGAIYSDGQDVDEQSSSAVGGSVSGLHNVAISGPQMIAAGVSSIWLWVGHKQSIVDEQGWILRSGSLAHLLAGALALHYAVKAKRG